MHLKSNTSNSDRPRRWNLTAANTLPLAEAALHYRRLGFAVVPTRLNAKGKHAPFQKNWQALRLSEEDVVNHWRQHPTDGIGLRLGVREPGFNNVHAIDLDVKPEMSKDGKKSFKALFPDAANWIQPTTYAFTPGNGVHILVEPAFTSSSTNRGPHGGIDRLASGVIVVAPTMRPDGMYKWQHDGILVAPPTAILNLPFDDSPRPETAEPTQSATIYSLRDIDVSELPITTDLKDSILSGDPPDRYTGDRSAFVGEVAFRLYLQGLDRDTVLSLLTDKRYGISAKPLEERRNNRQAAARWVDTYQWQQAAGKVGAARFQQLKPININDLRPARVAFPLSALPRVLREFAVEIAKAVGIAPEMVATPGLAVLSALVASRYDVLPQGNRSTWKERPNLWSLTVSPPGSGKTPATNAILAPIKKREAELWHEHTVAKELFDLAQRDEAKTRGRRPSRRPTTIEGNQTSGSLDGPSLELKPRLRAPVRPRLWIGDATVEALQKALSENPTRVLIVHRDEVVGLLAKLADDRYASERSFLLTSFTGNTAEAVDRISRDALYLKEPATSIIGNATPGVLLPALCSVTRQDGLWQRFQLLTFPDPEFRETSLEPEDTVVIEAWETTLSGLADRALAARPADNPAQMFDSTTPIRDAITFDEAAQIEFNTIRDSLRREAHALRDQEGIAGHLSKFPAFVASLAAILHVVDRQPSVPASIPFEALDRAKQLADYYRDQAERLYAAGAAPTKLALATISTLPKLTRIFSLREAYRNVRGLNQGKDLARRKELARQVLDYLAEHGYVRRLDSTSDGPGRKPSPCYAVHPVIVERLQIPERNSAVEDFADLASEDADEASE